MEDRSWDDASGRSDVKSGTDTDVSRSAWEHAPELTFWILAFDI